MKSLVYVYVFLLTIFPGHIAAASHPLQQLVDQLKTFSADFVQEREEEYFFRVERSTGTFDLMRPGLMRWDYQSPDQQHILVDGKSGFRQNHIAKNHYHKSQDDEQINPEFTILQGLSYPVR